MRKFFYSFLLFAFANLIVLDLYSFECLPKNQIWIAPEFYHVHRTREGGTYQNGFLYGGRAAYERIAGRCFYLGLEGYIATGSIHGKGGNDQKLRSTLTDSSVEGRVGYTFQLNYCYEFLFTPYLGYGYFWETNKFHRPKDLQVHFYNRFSYVPLGFLFNVNICPTWAIGLNFKARVLVDGKIKTKHDPEFQNSNLQYEHKVQYRVELPLSYFIFNYCHPIRLTLEPFYEYRHYGHHPNYPFDFLDTRFNIWGANLQVGYYF